MICLTSSLLSRVCATTTDMFVRGSAFRTPRSTSEAESGRLPRMEFVRPTKSVGTDLARAAN